MKTIFYDSLEQSSYTVYRFHCASSAIKTSCLCFKNGQSLPDSTRSYLIQSSAFCDGGRLDDWFVHSFNQHPVTCRHTIHFYLVPVHKKIRSWNIQINFINHLLTLCSKATCPSKPKRKCGISVKLI